MILIAFYSNVGLTTLEIILAISSIIIAACSFIFTIYIFRYQLRKNSTDLKLDWYKTLIIQSRFQYFFSFFESIQTHLKQLKHKSSISDVEKQKINNQILDEFNTFRQEFISLLLAVDNMLYLCVLEQFDNLIDGITEILFDESYDLSSDDFEKVLITHISYYKTKILQLFVEFKGSNDTHLVNSIKVRYEEVLAFFNNVKKEKTA